MEVKKMNAVQENKNVNIYIGIDLGTTNCKVCFGHVGKDKHFHVENVQIPMFDQNDSLVYQDLLPSFTYFPLNGEEPQVGLKAKLMLQTQSNRVIRSIKSLMGKNLSGEQWRKLFFNGKQYTPSEISALYLKAILNGINYKFNMNINEVIITVPASFDSDMRAATIKAAELAGIKTVDEKGQPINLLLDEPRASLFDFVNQLKTGFMTTLIDLSQPKIVLVYDLGGGTLDVSLHLIKYNEGNEFIDITDLAISRYTNIGGDTFDERLRDYLYEDYIKSKKINEKEYPQSEIESVKAKLFSFAEQFKVRITNRILTQITFNSEQDSRKITEKISPGYVLGNKSYAKELSMEEYEKLMEPLLRKDLKYPTEDSLKQFKPNDDIISPIIDVLNKAYQSDKKIYVPDLILLAGGMTKLPLIKNRLKQFFGKEPVSFLDPDKSVSRGASIYNYYIHHGYKPSTIIAESILFKDQIGLKTLVEAGTVITESKPYVKYFDSKWILSSNTSKRYALNFFRSDEQHPILKRYYELKNTYPKGTPVGVEVTINSQKIMQFKVFIIGPNKQKLEEATIMVDTTITEPIKTIEKKLKMEPHKTNGNQSTSNNLKDRILKLIEKEKLPLSEILKRLEAVNDLNLNKAIQNTLAEMVKNFTVIKTLKEDIPHYIKNNGEVLPNIAQKPPKVKIPLEIVRRMIEEGDRSGILHYDNHTEKSLLQASNKIEISRFILNMLIKKQIQNKALKNELIKFLGNCYLDNNLRTESMDDLIKFQNYLISFLSYAKTYDKLNDRFINTTMRITIEALGKLKMIDKDRRVLKILFELMDDLLFEKINFAIFTTLGKLPADSEIIKELINKFEESKVNIGNIISLLWALGKQCSRENDRPIIVDYFKEMPDKIIDYMMEADHYELIQKCVYCLIEMVSKNVKDPKNQLHEQYSANTIASFQNKNKILANLFKNCPPQRLNEYSRYLSTKQWLDLGINTLSGNILSEEEKDLLFSVRNPEEKDL